MKMILELPSAQFENLFRMQESFLYLGGILHFLFCAGVCPQFSFLQHTPSKYF